MNNMEAAMGTKKVIEATESYVTIRREDGLLVDVTWKDLRLAASDQNEEDLRVVYAALLDEAEKSIRRQRKARMYDGHEHVVGKKHISCFRGCVNGHDCNPVSHGNTVERQCCAKCDAVRDINSNRFQDEVGSWIFPYQIEMPR